MSSTNLSDPLCIRYDIRMADNVEDNVADTKDHHKNGTNCLPAWHAMR